MSFLKFEPTEENRQKLQKALHPDRIVYPVVLDELLAHPLARIGFYWSKIIYRSGLSPFAYAGITGQSPRKVMKQLEEEGTFTHISLCSVVQLPVCSLTYGIQHDRWPSSPVRLRDTYDDEILQLDSDENSLFSDRERAKFSPKWRNRTLEQMLKRYGGPSWRRHCTRVFDPFRANECEQLEGISPEQWRNMKKIYFLGEKLYAPTKSA